MHIPHGEFSITVKGSVVYADSNSAVNLEGATQFFNDLHKQTKHLDSWVLYFHVMKNTGVTPEAMRHGVKKVMSLKDDGCLGMVSRVETKLMLHLTKELYKGTDIVHLISDDDDEIEGFIQGLLDQHSAGK